MYTYHGFRHLRLVPRVLRYSTGFYGTAVTVLMHYFLQSHVEVDCTGILSATGYFEIVGQEFLDAGEPDIHLGVQKSQYITEVME
jgi:hypothetical protein